MSEVVGLPDGRDKQITRVYKNKTMTFTYDEANQHWHWRFEVHISIDTPVEGDSSTLVQAIDAAQRAVDNLGPSVTNDKPA